MSEIDERTDKEWRIASAVVQHMTEIGENRRPIVVIVYDMALTGRPYRDALADWAAYEDAPALSAHRWHAEICYWLLKDRQEVTEGVAAWFEDRAKEVRRLAH